jgi:flagellin
MGLRFDTNVPALNASRVLNRSGQELIQRLERLSSGLRINRAADDAEGLGMAVNFMSHERGWQTPPRIAREGVSLVQTAESHTASRSMMEGALNDTTTILQRIRELAVQASNDTQDTNNRTAIDGKVSLLLARLDAIDLGVDMVRVSSLASAISAIGMIDTAIKSVATLRGSLDAYPNRIEFTINTLAIQQENSMAAESAIRDAGIAAETIAFTRNEILVSTDSSVWAQANVIPQTALTLLGLSEM